MDQVLFERGYWILIINGQDDPGREVVPQSRLLSVSHGSAADLSPGARRYSWGAMKIDDRDNQNKGKLRRRRARHRRKGWQPRVQGALFGHKQQNEEAARPRAVGMRRASRSRASQ